MSEPTPTDTAPPAPSPPAPPAPAPPPAPQAAPAPQRLRVAARRAKAHAKITLLHARYVLGYLAAGFGVSAPVTLGYQVYYGQDAGQMVSLTGLSVLYGTLLLIPFLALEPVTRVAWEKMRVPEFRMFELTVSRWSMWVSLALFILSMVKIGSFAERMARWMPPGLFWTVFVLMGTAWAKIKAQVMIFPEFYADRGGDRILHVPHGDEDSEC